MIVVESFVDASRQKRLSDRRYQTDESVGALWKRCLRDYGKCVSRLFHDAPNKDVIPCGWCFAKKVTDSTGTYIQEVWVQLFKDDGATRIDRRKRPPRIFLPWYRQNPMPQPIEGYEDE